MTAARRLCIRCRKAHGHAFCRHEVRRPYNKRRSDCHNVRVHADHNSKVRVPGWSALGSGRLRERQAGPWPLPGVTGAIKAINASAPACSSPDLADADCRATAVKTAFARRRGSILSGVVGQLVLRSSQGPIHRPNPTGPGASGTGGVLLQGSPLPSWLTHFGRD
jgi:hypothetical protein